MGEEMKYLVVFYSRTGTTRRVAQGIAESIGCDIEEIIPAKSYSGLFGFLRGGFEATRKKTPEIQTAQKDPSEYDTMIIGTPVWGGTMASPLRTYLTRYGDRFKKVAFFLTKGGEKGTKTFTEMENLCGKTPVLTLELRKTDVKNEERFSSVSLKRIQEFGKNIAK